MAILIGEIFKFFKPKTPETVTPLKGDLTYRSLKEEEITPKGGMLMVTESVVKSEALIEHTEPFEKLLLVSENALLSCTNKAGDIVVKSWDQMLLKVTAVKHTWGRNKKEAQELSKDIEIRIIQRDENISLETFLPQANGKRGYVSYKIFIPRSLNIAIEAEESDVFISDLNKNLKVKTSSGNVFIRNVMGNVHAQTSSGSVLISNIGGNVTIITEKGEIHAENINGNVDVESSEGNIKVFHSKQNVTVSVGKGSISIFDVKGNAEVKATKTRIIGEHIEKNLNIVVEEGDMLLDDIEGNITVHFKQGSLTLGNKHSYRIELSSNTGDINLDTVIKENGRYIVETSEGTINVKIPTDASTAIVAKTIKGIITCELPLIVTQSSRDELTGVLNQYKALVKLTTSEGDINIRKK